MRVGVRTLGSRFLVKVGLRPRAVVFGGVYASPPRALAEDVFKAIKGMVAVLDAGELACRGGFLRPPSVLKLEWEHTKPGCEPDLIVLEVFAANFGSGFEGGEVGFQGDCIIPLLPTSRLNWLFLSAHALTAPIRADFPDRYTASHHWGMVMDSLSSMMPDT